MDEKERKLQMPYDPVHQQVVELRSQHRLSNISGRMSEPLPPCRAASDLLENFL
jgi:hypothetical protein